MNTPTRPGHIPTPEDAAERLAERGVKPGMSIEEYAALIESNLGRQFHDEWNVDNWGPKYPGPLVGRNTQVTRDSIRHLADGRGDINPLFRDEEYGRKTKYKSMIAPATYTYTIVAGHHTYPLNSLEYYNVIGGDETEWFCPIVEGDDVHFRTTHPRRVEIKQTRSIGKVIFVHGRHEYFRAGGIPIATTNFWEVLRPMDKHADQLMDRREAIPTYTGEEIAALHAAQDAETVRGAEPRYWEDVKEGDVVQPIVRGPHTQIETIAFLIGGLGGVRLFASDRIYRHVMEETGSFAQWDPRWSMWRNDHDDFFDKGRHGGFGPQRGSWIEMMLTNWMGDDGFVRKLRVEHRMYGGYGWIYTVSGTVVRTYVENGLHCVDFACRVVNQAGVEITVSQATVVLPSRDSEYSSYPADFATSLG